MSSSRPSWRPLLAGTVALFLVIFAFLAGQLRAGGDPALAHKAATQQTTTGATGAPPDQGGFGSDPSNPSGVDGFVPGGTAPAPAVPDQSSDAPSTHQS
jgi:hypothetical protein